MEYTERAGGAWMWAERGVIITSTAAASGALIGGTLESLGATTEILVRATPGRDLATSQIVKTISKITGNTIKVIHRVIKDGRVIHQNIKFEKFLPF